MDAVEKIKIPGVVQFGIYNNKGPAVLATLPSFIEHVRAVVQMPDIYPRGKSRAPKKDALNAKFTNHVYTIANEDEAKLFGQFIKGWNTVVGLEKVKKVKLRFPRNNLSLNSAIKIVMGDEMETHQKPGTVADKESGTYAPAGLVLKHIEKRASSLEEMLQKKTRCMKRGCPYAQYQHGSGEVTVNEAQSCSKRNERGCAGNTQKPDQYMRRA